MKEEIVEKDEKKVLEVKTITQANETLRLCGISQMNIGKLEARLNHKLQKVVDELMPEIEKEKAMMKECLSSLRKFAEEHKEQLFNKDRSIDLQFGTIGFQRSSQLATNEGVEWEKVLEAARKLYPDYVKEKYELIKAALKNAPEKTMTKLGVHIEEKDTFYAAGKDRKRYEVS